MASKAILVGLTGGIGSGKSTVAAGLRDRGAAIVDADVVAREVVEPGGSAYDDVVARFGSAILTDGGAVDRAALAAVVFADGDARRDLNAITHPRIGTRMAELVGAALEAGSTIVVLDVPLLNPKTVASYGLGAVIVVDVATDVAVERLVAHRGFDEGDARSRVAAQVSREQRRGLVDLLEHGWVVDNSGDRAALDEQLDGLWSALESLA